MSHQLHVTIGDEQYSYLQAQSEKSGASIAELVRRAIDTYKDQDVARKLKALNAGFGLWEDRPESTFEELRSLSPKLVLEGQRVTIVERAESRP